MKKEMPGMRRISMQAAILLLAGLAVWGAFLGPRRTEALFFSPAGLLPGAAVTALLFASAVLRLCRDRSCGRPLLYLGAALILAGAMWGSEPASRWRSARWGDEGPREGYLALVAEEPRAALRRVTGGRPGMLPFAVALESFHREYWTTGDIERLPREQRPSEPPVRSYAAHLKVIEGDAVNRGIVGVNRPLRHRGYHLYLYSFDLVDGEDFVVLYVKSTRALQAVYAGLVLLLIGACCCGWLEPVTGKPRRLRFGRVDRCR